MNSFKHVGIAMHNFVDASPKPHRFPDQAVRDAQQELFRLHAEGLVKPYVSETLPLTEAPRAMAKVAARGSTGKIVLVP